MPDARSAAAVNLATHILPPRATLDYAWLRPRYDGYMAFCARSFRAINALRGENPPRRRSPRSTASIAKADDRPLDGLLFVIDMAQFLSVRRRRCGWPISAPA